MGQQMDIAIEGELSTSETRKAWSPRYKGRAILPSRHHDHTTSKNTNNAYTSHHPIDFNQIFCCHPNNIGNISVKPNSGQ